MIEKLGGLLKYRMVRPKYGLTGTQAKSFSTLYKDADAAVKDIHDGARVLVGGFGLCGIPENLIAALSRSKAKNLTVISNNPGTEDHGIGLLLKNKQVKKIVASYVGENKVFEQQYLSGNVELELTPQGTLVEKIRAGGAGIPAFYTRTGVKTWIHEGKIPVRYNADGSVAETSKAKEVRTINGTDYLLEEAITADFALIKAWKADTLGNLIFRLATNNFNSPMARAARVTIAEAEEIVPTGAIEPEHVHVPGIFVKRLLQGERYEKHIERLVVRSFAQKEENPKEAELTSRDVVSQRAACELRDGMHVNLGIGIPSLVANHVPEGMQIFFQSENGIMGVGPAPLETEVDADLINAGKETISLLKGASLFPSDVSFAMIRGGHLSITMLGCMEVSQHGDLANWIIPRKLVKGVGGAMDLVSSPATRVVICTEHCSKNGTSKIVETCSLPLTGYRVVSKIITDKAVFDVTADGLVLTEKLRTLSVEDVRKITACDFKVSPDLCDYKNIYRGTI